MNASILASQAKQHPWFQERSSEYFRWYPKTLTKPNKQDWKGRKVSGIYLHIPYCDHVCAFCTYNKLKSDELMIGAFVHSLFKEIQLYGENGVSGPFEFIYFGGGTPSVLSDSQVANILQAIINQFGIKEGCEITFEMHPTHISKSRLTSLKQIGINRVSSGIQSIHEHILKAIHATHDADTSIRALDALAVWEGKAAIDLLYRCPAQTVLGWEQDLRHIVEHFNIPHLSCYSLYLANESQQPNLSTDIEMAAGAVAFCGDYGLDHYASCASGGFDFAKPMHQSQYERQHWMAPQASYLGVGPGALGFVGETLTANLSNVADYTRMLGVGALPLCSATHVDERESMHRYPVLGFKTITVPLLPFECRYGRKLAEVFKSPINEIVNAEMATIDDQFVQLTDLGRLFVDQISMRFWSEAEREVVHPETNILKSFEKQMIQ